MALADLPSVRRRAHSSYAFASVNRSLLPVANRARALWKSELSTCMGYTEDIIANILAGLFPLVHGVEEQRLARETRSDGQDGPQAAEYGPKNQHL